MHSHQQTRIKRKENVGKLKRTWFTKPLLDNGKRGQVWKKKGGGPSGRERTLKILHLLACIQWNYSKMKKKKKWTFRFC